MIHSLNGNISKFFLLALLAIVFPGPTHAQDESESDLGWISFGSYRESHKDLEVKVQGGAIKIWRIWKGDKRAWTINPQHADVVLSGESYSEKYQRTVASQIQRGPFTFKFSSDTGRYTSTEADAPVTGTNTDLDAASARSIQA